MKEVYNISRFEDHMKRCSGPKSYEKNDAPHGVAVAYVNGCCEKLASNSNGISRPKERPIVSKPCPGLTPTNIPHDLREKLATYFIRSPVPGGEVQIPTKSQKTCFPRRVQILDGTRGKTQSDLRSGSSING